MEYKMGAYDQISNASAEGRFPFIQTPGRHVCAIAGWKCRPTRKHGDGDFCDFRVLKSDTLSPDAHYTRLRLLGREGNALNEVKQRVMVAYASKGIPLAEKDVTGAVMQKIVEADGGLLKGAVIVVEVGSPLRTKSGQEFTPVNYFVPTRNDLDGLDLE
jgi:hypothetical protein